MWVAFYNKNVGDVLMLTRGEIPAEQRIVEKHGNVTLLIDKSNHQVMGINVFNHSEKLGLSTNGPQQLSESQWKTLQEIIDQSSIDVVIEGDSKEKFVVGYVEQCRKHEDSDHLSVTSVQVSDTARLQIVCGVSNIAQGMYVIVAKEGAVMPSGSIIWNGELRGVKSSGMICSTRELGLTDLSNEPGIWVLPEPFVPGTPLSQVVATLSA